MIACTVSFLITTIVMFTLSNPGSSGGPETERILSDQATPLGWLMALTYTIPLVLSCAFPIYGEACCKELKDEEVPDSEEKVQETRKVDYVVLVIAILHWGLIVLAVGVFIYANFLQGLFGGSSSVQEDWDYVFGENQTTTFSE